MVQGSTDSASLSLFAGLNAERALCGRGTNLSGIEAIRDLSFKAQPAQTRSRQEDGIILALFQFSQPRIDIPANRDSLHIGPQGQQLGGPAQ